MSKCDVCKKEYSPSCDFQQGRCPMHPPYINPHSMRFLNLFNAVKRFFGK